jgi:uncharacterized protein (DUF2062 family)
VLYRWEYRVGYWLLSNPHEWPPSLAKMHWDAQTWWSWTTFLTVGKPLLLGSLVIGAPVALLVFIMTKAFIIRHRKKVHAHEQATKDENLLAD